MDRQSPNLAEQTHPECLICGKKNPFGLHLDFREQAAGGVRADVRVPARFQGYREMVHGGIIATLLDSAMVHCLLKSNVPALTGDLNIRYRHPVPVGRPLELSARVTRQRGKIYEMEGSLRMDGKEMAKATARFMCPESEPNPRSS